MLGVPSKTSITRITYIWKEIENYKILHNYYILTSILLYQRYSKFYKYIICSVIGMSVLYAVFATLIQPRTEPNMC